VSEVGQPAPSFHLPSTSGRTVSLEDLRGKKIVLYFYPKDDTPGCTQEACDFRDNLARVRGAGAEVFGVSRDTLESHERFQRKYELPFELLSDDGSETAKAYGAFGLKNMYGKEVEGTIRSTYLIDENGNIAAAWSPVRVAGHVDQVLAALGVESAPVATPDAVMPSGEASLPEASRGSVTGMRESAAASAPAASSNGAASAAVRRNRTGAGSKIRTTRKSSSASGQPAARAQAEKPAPTRRPAPPKKSAPANETRSSARKQASSANAAKSKPAARKAKSAASAQRTKAKRSAPQAKKPARASAAKKSAAASRRPAQKSAAKKTAAKNTGTARSGRMNTKSTAKSTRNPVKSLRPTAASKAKKPARSTAAASRSASSANRARSGSGRAQKRLARRS
jgi:peroxiredoxin Q/BCP